MVKKYFVIALQKLDIFSSISIRLVQLTGKHSQRVHPKHLIKEKIWYEKYLNNKMKLLDFGCGNGLALIKVSKKIKEGIGIDYDESQLEIAKEEAKKKKIKNIKFMVHDCEKKLPFKISSFDAVVCSDVLEHLERRNQALNEIKRVLKNSGKFFLVVDNPDTSWKKLQKSVGFFYYADQDHKYEYSKGEIINKLSKAGFNITKINTVTYDTPLRGLIDLTGGFSLLIYKKLKELRRQMVEKNQTETTGYRIVANKTMN